MNYTYIVNVHEYVIFAVLLSQSNIGLMNSNAIGKKIVEFVYL